MGTGSSGGLALGCNPEAAPLGCGSFFKELPGVLGPYKDSGRATLGRMYKGYGLRTWTQDTLRLMP